MLRDTPEAGAPAVEATILLGVASNQMEERKGPEGIETFAHDMGNIAHAAKDPVRIRGRVFPGLRDASTCRIEVLQIRPG